MTEETFEPEPTEEERLREEARESLATPPEPIPGVENLPDDARDDRVEDAP